ncbi:MAG: DUF1189 family protein [Lachnospiraceae bacterium]|nr:DUF1189 family protein [Lachnospiraceae bacterium]MBR5918072.1 DUF1189 family protein [Lachnospiraceae bacterium]
MESNIGLFGQFKYVFKGIIKPRFFNRLANQSTFKVVFYTIIAVIASAAVYWGIIYLRCLGGNGFITQTVDLIKTVPQFTYTGGILKFEENSYIQLNENQYLVFNSDIENADKAYIDKVEILTDWSNGKSVFAFNGKSLTSINMVGMTSTLKYSDLANLIGLPNNFNREGFINIFKEKFIVFYLMLAGVSLIWFALKAVFVGFLFGGVGFGINKIIKQPYNYKEMVRISLYITGFTNILRNAINASPIKPAWMILNVAFLLIVGIYLFFALAGATEETGPSSTIVFNKPSSKKFEDIPAPDPFAKKNYDAPRTSSISFSRKSENKEPAPAPASQVATVGSAPSVGMGGSLYRGSSSSGTVTTSTPFTKKGVASETASTESLSFGSGIVEEPAQETAYESVSYSEPSVSYAEPETSYTTYTAPEPEPAPEPVSAIVKSDIGTFGGLGGISSGGSGEKKSKPKYDRPITAPDAYNGLYYSGSDNEESYESNYGSGTLIDRGSSYGKTLGAPASGSSSNPFASVLGVPTASTTTASAAPSGLGGSLYINHHDDAPAQPSEHVSFTTKDGSNPFGNGGFYLSAPPKKGSSNPTPNTVKKGGKTVNRYSDDDFAAWERETYAEDFKPRGGFGNNIF